jgi:flagellin-like hook-associated protein FlgL
MRHVFIILFAFILSAICPAAYLGSWAIDDYLTITATTHSPTTGGAAAASAITLRIYEDDTADEIVEAASMTAFDSITGLYKTKLQLTAAAGFEAGKCYTALIVATVSDVTAITTHLFQIQAKTTAVTVSDKTGYTLHADYNAAKTAAQEGDAMTLEDDAITAAKFDESTAFPLKSADTGATAIARTGADSDTLETLSDQIDGVGAGSGLDAAGVREAIGLASANLDDQLTSLGASSGSIEYTYTLTTDGTTPIPGAVVEVYTETARTNLVAKGTTNNFGVVVFYLDAGTYYFYRTKAGYSFTNPDTEVVAE